MTDPLSGVAETIMNPALGQNLQYAQLRQGIVTAIDPTNHACSVQLSGDPVIVAGVKVLHSYYPAIADVVWLLKSGSDLVALGNLTGAPSMGSYNSIFVTLSTSGTSTNSAGTNAWQNVPGTGVSFNFTKFFNATNLRVFIGGTMFTSAGGSPNTAGRLGVLVNGTDWACAQHTFSTTGAERRYMGGEMKVTSLNAGTYSIQARVQKYAGGAGTFLTMNTDDMISMSCMEVGG